MHYLICEKHYCIMRLTTVYLYTIILFLYVYVILMTTLINLSQKKSEPNIINSTNWKRAKTKHTTLISYLWIHKLRLHTVLDICRVLLVNARTHSVHVLVPQYDIQYPPSDNCQDFQNEHDRSPLQWNHVTSYRQMYGSQSQTLLIASRLMQNTSRINWKVLIRHLVENVDKWQDDVEIT